MLPKSCVEVSAWVEPSGDQQLDVRCPDFTAERIVHPWDTDGGPASGLTVRVRVQHRVTHDIQMLGSHVVVCVLSGSHFV